MKGWVAKDKNGSIFFYTKKPRKHELAWGTSIWSAIQLHYSDLPEELNPQWEDEEPIEVELIEVKLKIKKI